MQWLAPVDSPPAGHGRPLRPFLVGLLGLLLAVVLAAAIEGALGLLDVEGRVATGFFVAVAALVPVLALGVLLQLLTGLAGRTGRVLRELRRFDAEMSAEPPALSEESHRERESVSAGVRLFLGVLMPFAAGLLVQFVVTESVALLCIAAEVHERGTAIALGLEILALLAYLLFFNRILAASAKR